MNFISYSEKDKTLSVSFNTTTVWNYKNIDKVQYEKIVNSDNPEQSIKSLMHHSYIVGASKKEITL